MREKKKEKRGSKARSGAFRIHVTTRGTDSHMQHQETKTREGTEAATEMGR